MGETAIGGIDLTNCDACRSTFLAPYSPMAFCLLPMSARSRLRIGGDTERLLGRQPSELLGYGLEALIDDASIKSLQAIGTKEVGTFAFETGIEHAGRPFDAVVHQSDGMLAVELEPRPSGPPLNALA